MGNTKSKLDLLKQENAKLMLKNEITKLKQVVKNIEKQNQIVINDLKSSEYSTLLLNKSCLNSENATKCHNLNNSEILELDNQIVKGLIQKITYNQTKNIVSSEINPLYLNNDENMALDFVQSLSDLFDKQMVRLYVLPKSQIIWDLGRQNAQITSIWDLGFGISAKNTNYNLGFGILAFEF
ncbi:hypothetical protein Glove_26g277 [Diversispora epigaea]|uniref:Uncharacterized protein n=1 Tax=Diversispora epigaea TaxID=1348612 RepID=A0A397JJD8_9GLOM|nr:hypothetical protein Glove_26g277 [Diversispora epigaea]